MSRYEFFNQHSLQVRKTTDPSDPKTTPLWRFDNFLSSDEPPLRPRTMMMTSISDRIEPAVVDPSMTQSVDDGQLGNSGESALAYDFLTLSYSSCVCAAYSDGRRGERVADDTGATIETSTAQTGLERSRRYLLCPVNVEQQSSAAVDDSR